MLKPDWVLNEHCEEWFFERERCFIVELLNHAAVPEVSVARARVLAGVSTQLHSLRNTSEIYIIEEGQGLAEIGAEKHNVKAGDRVVILPETPQRITNTGDNDLIFLCICYPRFTPECYLALA